MFVLGALQTLHGQALSFSIGHWSCLSLYPNSDFCWLETGLNSSCHSGLLVCDSAGLWKSGNCWLFCFFLKASTVSAPASPINRKSRPVSMSSLSMHSPTYDSNTMPSDTPKKRRAPLPPHVKPSDLSQTSSHPDGNQVCNAYVSLLFRFTFNIRPNLLSC